MQRKIEKDGQAGNGAKKDDHGVKAVKAQLIDGAGLVLRVVKIVPVRVRQNRRGGEPAGDENEQNQKKCKRFSHRIGF